LTEERIGLGVLADGRGERKSDVLGDPARIVHGKREHGR